MNENSLGNLISIGGALEIFNCDNLMDLNGLEGVVSIGSDLSIKFNDNLNDVNGLSSVISIGGVLEIITVKFLYFLDYLSLNKAS